MYANCLCTTCGDQDWHVMVTIGLTVVATLLWELIWMKRPGTSVGYVPWWYCALRKWLWYMSSSCYVLVVMWYVNGIGCRFVLTKLQTYPVWILCFQWQNFLLVERTSSCLMLWRKVKLGRSKIYCWIKILQLRYFIEMFVK